MFENSSCHVLPQLCSCENSHVRKKGGGFLNDDVNTHTHTVRAGARKFFGFQVEDVALIKAEF